jgi:hypothetical protein
MTFAPDSIKDVRTLLVDGIPGLEFNEVGIVGDTNHQARRSSYHLGESELTTDSYSITESSRDRRGLSEASSAMDIGQFSFTKNGKTHNLKTFSVWLAAQCKAGAPGTGDIREIIYSPDGETVRRWDDLGIRSTGDISHTWHTHISWFRDSERRAKTYIFERYLIHAGLMEENVDLTGQNLSDIAEAVWAKALGTASAQSRFGLETQPARNYLILGAIYGYDSVKGNQTILTALTAIDSELDVLMDEVGGDTDAQHFAQLKADVQAAINAAQEQEQAREEMLRAEFNTEIGEVPAATLELLGNPSTPDQQVADALAQLLGTRRMAIMDIWQNS